MAIPRGRTTERTYYPALIESLNTQGGSGASEVNYNSEPDIVFDFLGRKWLMGVKIDETPAILKGAFVQYQRHKEESHLEHGVLLFFSSRARNVTPEQAPLMQAVSEMDVTAIVDTPGYKGEYRRLTFPQLLRRLAEEVGPKLAERAEQAYPLSLVIELLKQQVDEMMRTVSLTHPQLMQVITDRDLLSGISAQHLNAKQLDEASRFLASYIILSQVLFLRILTRARPQDFPAPTRPVTHHSLRAAFRRVLDVNYRPIFEMDVLDAITEDYLRDTFDLIWGLEIERSRYELPGRIFHELMPQAIRKLLAAFYTRPQAAELLAQLTIHQSNETVMDPACGSGTILTAAYRRKWELHQAEGKRGEPHRRFVEEEITGADIMPFAVHLSSANLSAMNPPVPISRTQIMQSDSLKLAVDGHYRYGLQLAMFPADTQALTTTGDPYEVDLRRVQTVLMNPPFTKLERGIQRYIDTRRFQGVCGKEIGLWGYFMALADELLTERGTFGGVIPISVLRGRESAKLRDLVLFGDWTPLYILKCTFNYGFSEWSEYRDILFIARKGKAPPDHRVKFGLLKTNLVTLTRDSIGHIVNRMEALDHERSADLDIESFPLADLRQRPMNLMWFCGVTDYRHRDVLVSFVEQCLPHLRRVPQTYFREGYRPVPEKVSSFMFLTRNVEASRTQEAFLSFDTEDADVVHARSAAGVTYDVERASFLPSLRTGIGLRTLSISDKYDYVAQRPYEALNRVMLGSGFRPPLGFKWDRYWTTAQRELEQVRTHLVVVHRINPFSPNTCLVAYVSETPFSPSNVLNVVREPDLRRAKALCVLFNSCLFLAQFFLLKEESTGRYINLRFYDMADMMLLPDDAVIPALVEVYERFANVPFPALRDQLDQDFEGRYEEFWRAERGSSQLPLFSLADEPPRPDPVRLAYDLAICKALGVPVTEADVREVYRVLTLEMIQTRGLQRD